MRTHHNPTEGDRAALSRLLPQLTDRDLPSGRREQLKDHLLTEIRRARPAPSPAPGTPAARPHRRQRHPATVIVAAGAAAAALAAVVVAGIESSASHPGAPTVSRAHTGAVRLLAKVADTAARQPAPHVRNSQYMYVKTAEASWTTSQKPLSRGFRLPAGAHLLKPVINETWMPVSDQCRPGLLRVSGASTPLGGMVGVKCPDRGSLNAPTYRLLQSLPTSPRALLALINRVERGHGNGPAQQAFETIGDLLRSTIAPPRISAALYRAAGLIPGVTLVPDATDAIGRHGVAVALTGPGIEGGIRDELIFNKVTLQLIGERSVVARTGHSTSASAIIARGFADRLGQVPHATDQAPQ
jgi:hypothetical protein